MSGVKRLVLAMVAAATLAGGPVLAATCKTVHSGACAHVGAACGPAHEHGRCTTYAHPRWHGPADICTCHLLTPPHG